MRNWDLAQLPTWGLPVLLVAMFWSLFWKGLALWHSAQRKEGIWFIVILLLNTLGLLEIIYIFGVAKIKSEKLFK